jgi:hypothetical protein
MSDILRLRQLAGLSTDRAALAKKSKKTELQESFDLLRKMAGIAPVLEKEEAEEEPADDAAAPAEGEEAEDDIPAIIKKIAKKAEGKTGEDLEGLLQKVYDAGFKDGVASTKEEKEEAPKEEDVKEALAPMGISDELAAKKIAAKIQGTPNLKMATLEPLVKKYLSMVGKAETDTKHLLALVAAELQDKGLMESSDDIAKKLEAFKADMKSNFKSLTFKDEKDEVVARDDNGEEVGRFNKKTGNY